MRRHFFNSTLSCSTSRSCVEDKDIGQKDIDNQMAELPRDKCIAIGQYQLFPFILSLYFIPRLRLLVWSMLLALLRGQRNWWKLLCRWGRFCWRQILPFLQIRLFRPGSNAVANRIYTKNADPNQMDRPTDGISPLSYASRDIDFDLKLKVHPLQVSPKHTFISHGKYVAFYLKVLVWGLTHAHKLHVHTNSQARALMTHRCTCCYIVSH